MLERTGGWLADVVEQRSKAYAQNRRSLRSDRNGVPQNILVAMLRVLLHVERRQLRQTLRCPAGLHQLPQPSVRILDRQHIVQHIARHDGGCLIRRFVVGLRRCRRDESAHTCARRCCCGFSVVRCLHEHHVRSICLADMLAFLPTCKKQRVFAGTTASGPFEPAAATKWCRSRRRVPVARLRRYRCAAELGVVFLRYCAKPPPRSATRTQAFPSLQA